jgi:hypothetical protein
MGAFVCQNRAQFAIAEPVQCPTAQHDGPVARRNAIGHGDGVVQYENVAVSLVFARDKHQHLPVPSAMQDRAPYPRDTMSQPGIAH